MTRSELDPAVLELIAHCLPSMDEVEVLLRLRHEDDALTAQELAERLQRERRTVVRAVRELEAAGLLVREGARFRYKPRTDARARAVALLARDYDERPLLLVRALHDRTTSAVRSFADAFRFRPRED